MSQHDIIECFPLLQDMLHLQYHFLEKSHGIGKFQCLLPILTLLNFFIANFLSPWFLSSMLNKFLIKCKSNQNNYKISLVLHYCKFSTLIYGLIAHCPLFYGVKLNLIKLYIKSSTQISNWVPHHTFILVPLSISYLILINTRSYMIYVHI